MGCPLFRGCLSIEVNGRAVGTFRIVCYIVGVHYSGVSVKRGSTVLQDYKLSTGSKTGRLKIHQGGWQYLLYSQTYTTISTCAHFILLSEAWEHGYNDSYVDVLLCRGSGGNKNFQF